VFALHHPIKTYSLINLALDLWIFEKHTNRKAQAGIARVMDAKLIINELMLRERFTIIRKRIKN
jgi:hypothetical protein